MQTTGPLDPDAAIVERYRQGLAAKKALRMEDSERLFAHVVKQYTELKRPPSFDAEASVAASAYELGLSARRQRRLEAAAIFFQDSAKYYEHLSTHPEARGTERAKQALANAARAREAAAGVARPDPTNLPAYTQVLTSDLQIVRWGGYAVQTFNGMLVAREPQVMAGDGSEHKYPIIGFPHGRWVTLHKRNGEPLPIDVQSNGVTVTVRFDATPIDERSRAAAKSAAMREFAVRLGELYRHPEGGISFRVASPDFSPPVLRLSWEASNQAILRPLTLFQKNRWTVARDDAGHPVPLRLRTEGGQMFGEWLNLSEPSTWIDGKVSRQPDPPGSESSDTSTVAGTLLKLLGAAAVAGAATWLSKRAEAKGSESKDDSGKPKP